MHGRLATFRSWIAMLALAASAGASAESRVINLKVYGDDTVCGTNLRSSHSTDIVIAPGCHAAVRNGEWVGLHLYRWADNTFLPGPRDARSISADARYVVSGRSWFSSYDLPVLLHDLDASTTTVVAPHGKGPVLTADGSAVLYGDLSEQRIVRWDRATGATATVTTISRRLDAASADGSVLVVGHVGSVQNAPTAIVDTTRGTVETLCAGAYDPCLLALSPDAQWVAYRAPRDDGTFERRLRHRPSGSETLLPDADTTPRISDVIFDHASRRMLFAQPWGSCGYSLFVRDLATFVDTPVAVESACPAQGRPAAFGAGDRIGIGSAYVTTLDVLFTNGAEEGVVDGFGFD